MDEAIVQMKMSEYNKLMKERGRRDEEWAKRVQEAEERGKQRAEYDLKSKGRLIAERYIRKAGKAIGLNAELNVTWSRENEGGVFICNSKGIPSVTFHVAEVNIKDLF